MANTVFSELYRSISTALAINTDHHLQFQRGPMYATYSRLREARILGRQQLQQQELEEAEEMEIVTPTPTKEKTKMTTSPMMARSVPDLSSVLRKEKENRRPLPSRTNGTAKASPLPPKGPRFTEVKTPSPLASSRSALRSVSSSVRKSCSYLKELKEFADVGESRLGNGSSRTGNYGVRKTVTAAASAAGGSGVVRRYGY